MFKNGLVVYSVFSPDYKMIKSSYCCRSCHPDWGRSPSYICRCRTPERWHSYAHSRGFPGHSSLFLNRMTILLMFYLHYQSCNCCYSYMYHHSKYNLSIEIKTTNNRMQLVHLEIYDSVSHNPLLRDRTEKPSNIRQFFLFWFGNTMRAWNQLYISAAALMIAIPHFLQEISHTFC